MSKRAPPNPMLWSLALALALAGCGATGAQRADGAARPAASPIASAPAPANPPSAPPRGLIPRRVLFDNPEKTSPRISPDGKYLSYLAPSNGVLNVWVGPIEEPAAARVVTNDTLRGIRFYDWTYDNRHIIYLQDKGGDENYRVYGVSLDDGKTTDLTPKEKVQARVVNISPKRPSEIVVGLNDRDPRFHDLYLVDLASGKLKLLLKNDGYESFAVDNDYKVRFANKPTKDGGREILQRTGAGFQAFLRVAMEDALTTDVAGLDAGGKYLYLTDSRERSTSALTQIEIQSRKTTLLFADPEADVTKIQFHPQTKRPQAVASEYERRRWTVLDKTLASDFAELGKLDPGVIEVVSKSLDDRHWIVSESIDDGPTRYHHYDRDLKRTSLLFSDRPELERYRLEKMEPLVIPARDGKRLVSYLTMPDKNVEKPEDGIGAMPMVLLVHGGPWGRDSWGFNAWHQWLANRGYAVLSVNFRGSTGFGKDFVNAANKEWARSMHDDLIAAVDFMADDERVDSTKVAIMGGSYGGYATLVGLTFTPDKFACGVDIVGPSNLFTLLSSIPPYWESYVEIFAARIGDQRTPEGRKLLEERSPLSFVDRIKRPLVIGQGKNDPRVKQAESDQIVQAMQSKKIPVTYVLYPDEGHGFARPENKLSFNAVAEAFLAGCLGGQSEPIGDDFKGSSITVPAGASYVPGLSAALAPKKP